jgi:hypothetical protein
MKTSLLLLLLSQPDSPGQRLYQSLARSLSVGSAKLRSPQWLLAIFLSISPLIMAPLPTYGYLAIFDTAERADFPKPIQIQRQALIISKKLQQELTRQIPELDRQLKQQSQLFSIPINQHMNLVYVHQGQEYWKIEFTYGGYLLSTTDETIYSTQEIFRLKQDFRSIDKIYLADRSYDTNGSMQQMGPILHNGAAGC